MGIQQLSHHPHGGHAHPAPAAEVGERSGRAGSLPHGPRHGLQVREVVNRTRRPAIRLRTKFLIAMLLTSAGLTAASLLVVQRSVENQVRRNLQLDLANSVETFRNFQKEREESLARSAELMADLPVLKALMTSRHAPTIQDASREMFRLSGGDLFALLDPADQFVGFHTKSPGITREQAQQLIKLHSPLEEPRQWWFAEGHLYEVVLAPIYFGPRADNSLLGVV